MRFSSSSAISATSPLRTIVAGTVVQPSASHARRRWRPETSTISSVTVIGWSSPTSAIELASSLTSQRGRRSFPITTAAIDTILAPAVPSPRGLSAGRRAPSLLAMLLPRSCSCPVPAPVDVTEVATAADSLCGAGLIAREPGWGHLGCLEHPRLLGATGFLAAACTRDGPPRRDTVREEPLHSPCDVAQGSFVFTRSDP